MHDGPMISRVAALIGDPARANILVALMDGRALTVTELASAAGVTVQTASGHLAKLREALLTQCESQGRHRYFRLSGPDIAEVLEGLMGLAQRVGAVPVRTGPSNAALRRARLCYDHLAGETGVGLFERLVGERLIEDRPATRITDRGRAAFSRFGIDMAALEARRRPLCRECLDWSERRHHLGGALGAALFAAFVGRGWVVRGQGRVVEVAPRAIDRFADLVLA